MAACTAAPEVVDTDTPKATDIRALRWIAPGADRVKALTEQPASCLRQGPLATPDIDQMIGELAFDSPALLGGAAGRMGLSCASCHRNGRDNPAFLIDGVSGAPGTADVTSSLFSKVRGNGAFDPTPIPDLVARDGNQNRDRGSEAFRLKVHGLVVEEFDGQEPPSLVFEGLLAYLDELDTARCPDASGMERIELRTDTSAVTSALGIAGFSGIPKDVSILLVRIARERLERIHERFAGPGFAREREEILAFSRKLAGEADTLRAGGELSAALSWSGTELWERLRDAEPRSLYSPDVLRAALARGEGQ